MSDRLSLRGAPVPMMTEGVGETECLADALSVSAASAIGGRFFFKNDNAVGQEIAPLSAEFSRPPP